MGASNEGSDGRFFEPVEVANRPESPSSEAILSPLEIELQEVPVLLDQDNDKKKQRPVVSPLHDSLNRLWHDMRARVSLIVLGLLVVLALVGPSIYQHIGGPYTSNVDGRVYGPEVYHGYTHEELDRLNELPSGQYWLGTDEIGRDILARLLQGLLVSLGLAVSVEVFDVLLGITIGVLAGFYGGWIDQFLARFTDLIFAFPSILFIILLNGIFGGTADTFFSKLPVIGADGNGRIMLLFISLALFAWPVMARLVRGQTLQLKEQQFIEAARTSGTSDLQIILRHIVPNLVSIVVVVATLDLSTTIVSEAGISLLGFGIQPPASSLGLMITNATSYIQSDAWAVLVPSITLAIIVLAFSFLGDGLRDAFDPRSRS